MQNSGNDTFIPRGASRFWPFVVGTRDAYCAPRWNAHLLLCWGITEAVLGIQSTRPRENWRTLPREHLTTLMHREGAGKEHPSRQFVATLISQGESVLDVGCGAGVGYEALAAAGLETNYAGIDSSEPSIEIARELYPGGDFRLGNATTLVPEFGRDRFDVVLVRHVLEHLPDFELAMDQAISVSRRLAVFVFYLTPRSLPLRVRKVDTGPNRPYFYEHVYSRPAIDRYLSKRGLYWRWVEDLGTSRAGWFANEVNSALLVSKNFSELRNLPRQ